MRPNIDPARNKRAIRASLLMASIRYRTQALEQVYSVSAAALHAEQLQIRTAVSNMGELAEPEYLEGVGWPPDPLETAIDRDNGIDETLAELRVSLTISLYHAYEKLVLKLTGATEQKIWPAIKILRRQGIVWNMRLCNELRLTANAAKHGPLSEDMKTLKEKRKELVEGDEVIISVEQFVAFCEIFRTMRFVEPPKPNPVVTGQSIPVSKK